MTRKSPIFIKGKEVTFSTDIFPNIAFQRSGHLHQRCLGSGFEDHQDLHPDHQEQPLFKQNMFLKMKILNGKKRLPVVPKTALLYKDGKFTVYLSVAGKYELKEIKPAFDVSDKLIAVEGLKDGDEVVLSAIGLEKT